MNQADAELSKVEKKVIHTLCLTELQDIGAGDDVESCLRSLENLEGVWRGLLRKQAAGEADRLLPDDLVALYTLHQSFFAQGGMAKYFAEYCREVIRQMADGRTIGDVVKPYSDAMSLCETLFDMLQYEEEANALVFTAIASQQDFYIWKDSLLLETERQ